MPNPSLQSFVNESRSHGKTDAEIKTSLLAAGWPETDINQAFSTVSMPMPTSIQITPEYHPNLGMWIVFEYVLMFITLAFTATGLAGLLHHLVNNKIAPIAKGGSSLYNLSYYTDYLVPFYVACLIIAFPIFAFLALKLRARLERFPEVRTIKVRKVFIYIALTWTFLAMLSRLIRTVYSFLSGDTVALNVISHLVVTLIVCGIIFVYFAIEVKQDSK